MLVLHEDNHLLAVYKDPGVLVQGDRTGDVSLLDLAKVYLKEAYDKPGEVFLGLVHRLDRPVSGVVMFARTSKAASRLAAQFRSRDVRKVYLAIVLGRLADTEGVIESFLQRKETRSRTVSSAQDGQARLARLTYRVLSRNPAYSLVEVVAETGRHHQIRVQLAEIGHPVVGDVKYGAQQGLDDRSVALHASELVVTHPTTKERVRVVARPGRSFPWKAFEATTQDYYR